MTPKQEKPEECDCCHFKTSVLASYRSNTKDGKPNFSEENVKWLCDLCAATPAGNSIDYPHLHQNPDVMQTICYVGNEILKAIRTRI